MAAIDDFHTAMSAAATALSAGSYDTARTQVLLARIHLARIPNSQVDGASAQWRDELASIEASITAAAGRASRGVHVSCEFAS